VRGPPARDAQFLQFPVNPGRAPQGVGLGHPADERSDLRGDRRAAGPAPPTLPGPDELEASALPPDDGLGLDDGDGLPPAAPQAGQQDPQHPIGGPQAWTRSGALEDGQLVPQGEVLEHQGPLGGDPTGEAGEDQGEHGGQHRSGWPEGQS